jgi:hypothetical protein
MDEYSFSCPDCQKDDIYFLKIEMVGQKGRERGIFYCNLCQKKFIVKEIRAGYLPNLVALLKQRYPERKKEVVLVH